MSKITSIPARIKAFFQMPGRVSEIHQMVAETHRMVADLNHDIRSGAGEHLPLYLGYVERLRLDSDSAIAVTKVVERQLDIISRRLDDLENRPLAAEAGTARPGPGSS